MPLSGLAGSNPASCREKNSPTPQVLEKSRCLINDGIVAAGGANSQTAIAARKDKIRLKVEAGRLKRETDMTKQLFVKKNNLFSLHKFGLIYLGAGVSALYLIVEKTWALTPNGLTVFIAVAILLVSVLVQLLLNYINLSRKTGSSAADETHALQWQERKARLREIENINQTLFENTYTATIIIDQNNLILRANSAFARLSGYDKKDIQGRKTWLEFIDKNYQKNLRDESSGRGNRQPESANKFEAKFIDKNQRQKDIIISLAPIPETSKRVASISDISRLKKAESQIHHQAFHDTLTNLPNRDLFLEHLALAIKRTRRRTDYYFAVLQLDIDRFKLINDSIGHNLGDKLLVAFANKLQRCLRDIDTLARFGGDEFIIILEDTTDPDHAVKILQRLQKQLQRPFVLDGNEIFTSTSFGAVLNTKDYRQPEDIIRDVGTALYHAKMKGRAQFQIFNQNLHEKAVHLLQIENDLRKAVKNNEFELHYQPIVSVDTAAIVGFEALIRWNHPQRGLVFPDTFVSVAEETGLIIPIGKWALQQACKDLVEWQRDIKNNLAFMMSVNVSSRQFLRSEMIAEIQEILAQSGLPPDQLKLEITETALMEDRKGAIRIIKKLKELGIHMVIDDFGTGYSSMSYLQQLPVDMLKIDRSFVSRMHQKPDENIKIVETVITLAHKLQMIVVAEGVETAEQQGMLADLKCQLAQGYYFARPLDRTKINQLMGDIAHFTELHPGSPYILKDMAFN